MIVLVMIPEILLTSYIFGKYSVGLGFPEFSTRDFLSSLIGSPLFLVIVILIFIVALILYITLQIK